MSAGGSPLTRLRHSATEVADRLLRRALERLHGSGPVLVPEYPLQIRPRWGWQGPVLSEIAHRLEARTADYERMLEDACRLGEWALTIDRRPRPGQPCWENDYWGTVDALVQCAALKRRNPALYLEIGAGYSTLFARRAIQDFELDTRIVSIDPHPRSDVERSCDEALRAPLTEIGLSVFDRVAPGDVLLIDGSHTALMNSDATVVLLEVLPRLPAGVLLGIDDVFLPWDYPPTWESRIYGEQYLLAAMLLGGAQGFDVRFPGWWLVEECPLAQRLEPLWPTIENRFGRHSTSFWIETL
jgi:Methyltransferase domain